MRRDDRQREREGQLISDCGLRIADCGLRVAGCGLRVAGCGLRVAGCYRERSVLFSIFF